MTKVITFSRSFPAYHPKAGQQTFFVEKIYKSLFLMKTVPPELANSFNFSIMNDDKYLPKHHTIRAGNRWKVGDKFSPRVWSGKPYNSPQIIITPDIEVVKVWDFKILNELIFIGGKGFKYSDQKILELSKNDGLTLSDLLFWFRFPKPFIGQIICWDKQIEY